MDARSELEKLASPEVLEAVTAKAAEEFTHDFARVEEAVVECMAPELEGGLEEVRALWPRTVDEVTVLLN